MSEQAQNPDEVVQNFYGIFGNAPEDVSVVNNGNNGPSPYFNPDSLNAPNKTYSAVIKFLPNIDNPSSGLINVQKYEITEPNGTTLHYKSEKSLDKYAKCPVASKYWDLNGKNQTNAMLKEAGKQIKWKSNTYGLIQVIEDDVKPENVGKIFVWNVPSDIAKLIEQQRKPSPAMLKRNITPNNVFDPIEGRCLILDIPVKSISVNNEQREVRDYTRCVFDTSGPTHMLVNNETVRRKKPETAEEIAEFQKAVIDVLTSPDTFRLKDFGYSPETPEHQEKCLKAINDIINIAQGNVSAQAVPQFATQTATQVAQPAAQPVATGQPVQQAQPAQPAPVQAAQPVQTQPAQPAATGQTVQQVQQPAAQASTASDDVLDGIFNQEQ